MNFENKSDKVKMNSIIEILPTMISNLVLGGIVFILNIYIPFSMIF